MSLSLTPAPIELAEAYITIVVGFWITFIGYSRIRHSERLRKHCERIHKFLFGIGIGYC